MAISDTIQSMKEHLQDAYNKLQDKGATIPTNKNLENLAGAIETVSTGTDTSDATATASDILAGKTAYAASGKVTGTIETWDGSYEEITAGSAVVFTISETGISQRYYFRIYDGTDTSGTLLYEITNSTSAIPSPLTVTCSTGHLYVVADSPVCSITPSNATGGVTVTSNVYNELTLTVTSAGTLYLRIAYDD